MFDSVVDAVVDAVADSVADSVFDVVVDVVVAVVVAATVAAVVVVADCDTAVRRTFVHLRPLKVTIEFDDMTLRIKIDAEIDSWR